VRLGKLVVLKIRKIVGTYAYVSELLLRTEHMALHPILNNTVLAIPGMKELICKFKICRAIHKPK